LQLFRELPFIEVSGWDRSVDEAHLAALLHTCEAADPATKGGSGSTVKLAKADLVPKDTNHA